MDGKELGATVTCPNCEQTVTLKETIPNAHGRVMRYWSDCNCLDGAFKRSDDLIKESGRIQALQAADRENAPFSDLTSIAGFRLDNFNAAELTATPGAHPLEVTQRWLGAIYGNHVAPSYHQGPPAALFFYSPGKGRGKTHLAGGIANDLHARGRLVAFADEISYIERYWAATTKEKERQSALVGERTWLSVLDDLGQREGTPASLRDAWYDIINPRWLKRGWTIITSNWTPDQLLSQGTINEATYSRLVQMTRGELITFHGSDYRLKRVRA